MEFHKTKHGIKTVTAVCWILFVPHDSDEGATWLPENGSALFFRAKVLASQKETPSWEPEITSAITIMHVAT